MKIGRCGLTLSVWIATRSSHFPVRMVGAVSFVVEFAIKGA